MGQAPRSPLTARPSRAERTQQRILDAAGECFAAAGFAKTTVEEVAARAGVSKALVYHHFHGKEELLDAVLERTVAAWERVTIGEALASEGRVLERLGRMQHACMAFAREAPVLRAILEVDPRVLIGTGAGRAMMLSMDRLRAALVQVIRDGVRAGELREDLDAESVARVLLVNHIAFVQHILDPAWVDVSHEVLMETGLDILARGLVRASG